MKIINPEIIEPGIQVLSGGGTTSCDDCYCYTCSYCDYSSGGGGSSGGGDSKDR